MKLTLDQAHAGWYELSIGVGSEEVDRLIALLAKVRDDPKQHFHLSHEGDSHGGPGRVTFYASFEDDEPNGIILSEALLPGDAIPG
jgi:hypothetical protein